MGNSDLMEITGQKLLLVLICNEWIFIYSIKLILDSKCQILKYSSTSLVRASVVRGPSVVRGICHFNVALGP